MSYIVIFNVGFRDPEMLTDDHGYIEEFSTEQAAIDEAEKWIDDDQYRNYEVYEREIR